MFTEREIKVLLLVDSYSLELYKQAQGEDAIKHGSHGLDHWRRVAGLSRTIAAGEEQNPFLPVLAGLIHDLGRIITDDPRSMNSAHGKLSIEIARDFINDLPIATSEKDLILEAVEDHPLLNHQVRRNGLVEILQDADRCDGLGPLGVVKASQWKWHIQLHPENICPELPAETKDNIFHWLNFQREWFDMLWTPTARELIRKDVEFFEEYINRYGDQVRRFQDSYRNIWANK